MARTLSLVIITKNAAGVLRKTLESIDGLVNEIIVIDDYSTDATRTIAKSYGARIFTRRGVDIGMQREYGILRATGEYILLLDADEVVSPRLAQEIKMILASKHTIAQSYKTPFINHLWGKPLRHGGETYTKICIFKRGSAHISSAFAHQQVITDTKQMGELHHPILHYSYTSLVHIFRKFTDYALRMAVQKKQQGERSSLQKIIRYPIHMFWARFVRDKGYQDGVIRIPLDIAFAYMELMMYIYLFIIQRS